MEDVSIIIATYGDYTKWSGLALRAKQSAQNQSIPAKEVIRVHKDTLQEARNYGASQTKSEWLVFLDADDTLNETYVEGILNGTGDLRQPKTLGVYSDGHEDPQAVFIPRKSFDQGNFLVIGTGVRREFFEKAGGFWDEPLYEDWSLWWRCWLEGAEIGQAPKSVYRVAVNDGGRNLPDRATQVFWFEKIANTLKPLSQQKGLL